MVTYNDRLKWDRRYLEGVAAMARPEPHPLASRWCQFWSRGAMLDAACGRGRGIASMVAASALRTAIGAGLRLPASLAPQHPDGAKDVRNLEDKPQATGRGGFAPVYGVDLSPVVVAQASQLWSDQPHIHWIVGDVTALDWPEGKFGLICAFGFTDLPFFRRIPGLLRAGGMFLYEGFAPRQLEIKPALNPEWVGEPQVLCDIFGEGRILECAVSEEPPYRTRLAALTRLTD